MRQTGVGVWGELLAGLGRSRLQDVGRSWAHYVVAQRRPGGGIAAASSVSTSPSSSRRRTKSTSRPGCGTLLLRSVGRAVARGSNRHGQCDIPELQPGATYIANGVIRDLVTQLFAELRGGDGAAVGCHLLTGDALTTWIVADEAIYDPAIRRVRVELSQPRIRLRVVHSDGSCRSSAPRRRSCDEAGVAFAHGVSERSLVPPTWCSCLTSLSFRPSP